MSRWIIGGVILVALFGAVAAYMLGDEAPLAQSVAEGPGPFDPPYAIRGQIVVKLPQRLSDLAAAGAVVFGQNCASCHGASGSGTEIGPPLVHVIYEPSHHGDASFFLAVQQGVRGHHWRYGDMEPVPGVDRQDVTSVIAFIRAVQRANGIQ